MDYDSISTFPKSPPHSPARPHAPAIVHSLSLAELIGQSDTRSSSRCTRRPRPRPRPRRRERRKMRPKRRGEENGALSPRETEDRGQRTDAFPLALSVGASYVFSCHVLCRPLARPRLLGVVASLFRSPSPSLSVSFSAAVRSPPFCSSPRRRPRKRRRRGL